MRESGQIAVGDWENFLSPLIFLSVSLGLSLILELSLKTFSHPIKLVIAGGLVTFSQKISTPPYSFFSH